MPALNCVYHKLLWNNNSIEYKLTDHSNFLLGYEEICQYCELNFKNLLQDFENLKNILVGLTQKMFIKPQAYTFNSIMPIT
jgi:hypothetical protein